MQATHVAMSPQSPMVLRHCRSLKFGHWVDQPSVIGVSSSTLSPLQTLSEPPQLLSIVARSL